MIDKAAFITIVGSVYTQREEVVLKLSLYLGIIFIIRFTIVHIKQVAHPCGIILAASIVSALYSDNFSNILNYIGAGWDSFLSE